MMNLAIFSDIHANLPALKAVLQAIDQQSVDELYCLGDLVNFAGWDNEVIELVMSRHIPCLQGNHDEGIGRGLTDFTFSCNTEDQKAFGYQSIGRVNKVITEPHRQYLVDLPFMRQIIYRTSADTRRIVMEHGSPQSTTEYVQQEATNACLIELMQRVEADVLLIRHTHIPYHKVIPCQAGNRIHYRHAINIGSVGKTVVWMSATNQSRIRFVRLYSPSKSRCIDPLRYRVGTVEN